MIRTVLQRLTRAYPALKARAYRLPWLTRRRKSSLLARLMTIACIWGGVILALAVVGLWWTANLAIEDNVRRQSLQWLSKLDELGTPLFLSRDPRQFEAIRRHIADVPEISFVRYLAPDGQTELARYLAPGIDPGVVLSFTSEELQLLQQLQGTEKPRHVQKLTSTSLFRVSAPAVIRSIPSDGLLDFSISKQRTEEIRVIGFVDAGINFGLYREHLWRHIFYGSLLILCLFIMTLLIGRRVIRQALQPLAELQIPLGRLARGDTDIQVESHGASEIAAIGNALNTTIAALKQRDQELNRLANFDTLTGLYNRHSFTRELEKERARIVLDDHFSALLFIDLDRFKEVNDSAGHAAGDELLIQVAHLLRTTVRNSDIVSRLGGDEFTIILSDVTPEHAEKVAEQICLAMHGFTFSAERHTFHISCSIGIAMIDASQASASTILSQADTACHAAKSIGRNHYQMYRAGTDGEDTRLYGSGVREKLEQALANHDFFLVFQPIRDQLHAASCCYEAFLRIRVAGEEFPAATFIASAERFNLIQRIDCIAITLAIDHLRLSSPALRLSLNLSARTTQQTDIVEFIAKLLREAHVAPERLIFEIPEKCVIDNVTQTKNFMEGIKGLGCALAIDNFGVSLNSLTLLQGLPVDLIKLDDSIVSNLSSPFNHALVTAIVLIARELGIRTVAKNVCRVDEAHQLEQLGIDLLQGHLIGRPVTQLPASA